MTIVSSNEPAQVLDSVALGPPIGAAPDSTVQRAEDTLDQLDALWDQLEVDEDYEPSALTYSVPEQFKLSIVIPVYNEEATVLEVLGRVRTLPLNTEIIVVDDHSTDATRERLQTLQGAPGLKLLFKPCNEGKGAALRSGFEVATGDVVVVQDADLEYDPRDILSVVEPIVTDEVDVVYGSRFLGDEPQDPSLAHRFLNRTLTVSSNLFTGLRLTDMETCYKAFRREVIQGVPLRQNRFGFEPEVTAKLARRGYQVVERPIRYDARGYAEGKKIGIRDLFNALYCIFRYGIAD
jgi:glycosyltransferase involved in cell wall biosynthesis